MFGRNRFSDLIARQLDIFGEENAELLREIAEYRDRWRRASRTGAPRRPSAMSRIASTGPPRRCRSSATATPRRSTEPTEAEYRRAFTKAVRRRLPALADEFEAETDTGE